MADNNLGTKVSFLLAGIGIGAAVALLFAPRSGEETRELIGKKAGEGRDYIAGKTRELRQQAEDYVDKGRKKVEKIADAGRTFAERVAVI
jgi:gas vesicle protein